MAFSAISQAGYLVLGVVGGTPQGMTALVYYLFVYLVANLGLFAIINITEQRSGKINISDYDGFYETNSTVCRFLLEVLYLYGRIQCPSGSTRIHSLG